MLPSATFPAARWQPYCGEAAGPEHWLAHWNLDPVLVAALIAALVAGLSASRRTARSQIAAAAAVVLLFVTPLCALGSSLFLARSAHHLALVLVLAPLLVSAVGSRTHLRLPLASATAIQVGLLWAWHVPALYEAALASSFGFWLMQLSITAGAAAWWLSLRRAPVLTVAAALLAQMVQMGLLGALLVFAGRPFYAPHWLTTAPWGLTPLEDQQIAGLVMWVVGGGAYLLAAVTLLWRHLAPAATPRPA